VKLWVGLGNPGLQYEGTRHNIGAAVVALLAEKETFQLNRGCKSLVAKTSGSEKNIIYLLPQTFMNLSGDAVQYIKEYYKITPGDITIFHDEIELAPGEIRYKFGGGHKGHNGLRDIIQKTGSADFHRVRIGVGRPADNISVAHYVLSPMPGAEFPNLDKIKSIIVENKLE